MKRPPLKRKDPAAVPRTVRRECILYEIRMFVHYCLGHEPRSYCEARLSSFVRWIFWYRQQRAPGNKITNYEEGIKKVAEFSSVSFSSDHVNSTLTEGIPLFCAGGIILVSLDPSQLPLKPPAYDRLSAIPQGHPPTCMGGPSKPFRREMDHPPSQRHC